MELKRQHELLTDEEPCEEKLSRTVLKTSRRGDFMAEFNPSREDTAEARPMGMPKTIRQVKFIRTSTQLGVS